MSNTQKIDTQRDVKQLEKLERRTKQVLDEELRQLLGDPKFRRFVWQLLGFCRIDQISYLPGNDAQQTSFNEGQRNVGLFVQARILEVRPEAWLLMMNEPRTTES